MMGFKEMMDEAKKTPEFWEEKYRIIKSELEAEIWHLSCEHEKEIAELKQAVRKLEGEVFRFGNLAIDLYHFCVHVGADNPHWNKLEKKYTPMIHEIIKTIGNYVLDVEIQNREEGARK